MNENEARYLVISALLQSSSPLTLTELTVRSGLSEGEVLPVIDELVRRNQVVKGGLLIEKPAPQYCWRAHWDRETQLRALHSRQRLQAIVSRTQVGKGARPEDVDSEATAVFCDYVINEYNPPKDKRILVFLQCSVRRPFSSSPSHSSMRRAIAVATGYDPRSDFESCPVHVVVLASKVGPVPYELEDVYPANIRGGGVKHFSWEYYTHVKPILADRVAQYIISHRNSYDHITTFTESRYGEVMLEARQIAGVEFRILPVLSGPEVTRIGTSRPRTYWERFWIQLYLEIIRWINPDQRATAEVRLKKMNVNYNMGTLRVHL